MAYTLHNRKGTHAARFGSARYFARCNATHARSAGQVYDDFMAGKTAVSARITAHAKSRRMDRYERRMRVDSGVWTSMIGACEKTAPTRGNAYADRQATSSDTRTNGNGGRTAPGGGVRRGGYRVRWCAPAAGPSWRLTSTSWKRWRLGRQTNHRLACRAADHASRCTFRTRRRFGGGFSLAVNVLPGISSALNELKHSAIERVLVGGFSLAADELIDSSMDEPDAGCRGSLPVSADDALEM